jgi:hypothetical protein
MPTFLRAARRIGLSFCTVFQALYRFGPITSADCCERRKCVAAIFAVRDAPAHDEPHSGPNNSEREPTSGRSTKYGSGHLIRVFRDIGRISSLLFLLSHPSPVGHPRRRRVQKRKTLYGFVEGKNGFNYVSCGTHRAFRQTKTPPDCALMRGRGLGNPRSSAANYCL